MKESEFEGKKRSEILEDDFLSDDYLAGFIDGDGCIELSAKRKNGKIVGFNPCLSISNTNKRILKLIQKNIGGQIYVNNKGSPNKVAYDLRINKLSRIKKVLEPLVFRLRIKKLNAVLMIAYCELRLKNYKKKYTGKEEEAYEIFRMMNKRGPGGVID